MKFYSINCQAKTDKTRFKDGNNFRLIDCGIWTGENLTEAKQKAKEHFGKTNNPNKFSFYGIEITNEVLEYSQKQEQNENNTLRIMQEKNGKREN